jgi:hypothetical protein
VNESTIDQLPTKMRSSIALELCPVADLDGFCWAWTGGRTTGGYGLVAIDSPKRHYVHRLSYTILVGPIPPGLQIDHLCRNRRCCNPRHLEPVTNHVNTLRGEKAQKTHCVHGHPLSGDNLIWTNNGPDRPRTRKCRTCENRWQREHYKRRGGYTPEQRARKTAQQRVYRARHRGAT